MGDYEGQAYDVKNRRLTTFHKWLEERIQAEGNRPQFVVPERSQYRLPEGEVRKLAQHLAEGHDPPSPPAADVKYGQLQEFEAVLAAATAMSLEWRAARLSEEAASCVDPFKKKDRERAAEAAQREYLEANLAAITSKRDFDNAIRLKEHRVYLGELIATRRRQLGMTQSQLAEAARVSLSTVKVMENSDDPDRIFNRKTVERLEKALKWGVGSFQNVMNGKDPITVEATDVTMAANVSASATFGAAVPGLVSENGPVWTIDPDALDLARVETPTLSRAIYPDQRVSNLLDQIQFREGRNVNEILEDALHLYEKMRGPRQDP